MARIIKVAFVIITVSIFSTYIVAQENFKLEVLVYDEAYNQPIEFANVFITPCSCGGVTDADGLFKIELPEGEYQVLSSFIGYENDTTKITLDEDISSVIRLGGLGLVLESITVQGESTQQNIEKTVMGVQQLTIEKIKTLPTAIGEVDILKSLTMLSGVGSAGEASNGLSVRGGSLDQNLVLLDQAPVYNTTHLFGLFSVFTPDAIRGVDLYQANMPSKYGGRISSVVDIKVENPDLNKFKFTGGVGLVSNRLAVSTPIKKGKAAILIAGRASYNDFLLRQVKRLKNTKANFIDGTLKFRYQINTKNSLFFTSFYSQDFYQLDLSNNVKNLSADVNQFDYSTFNNTLTWISNIGEKAFLTTHLIRSDYQPNILFPQTELDNVITFSSGIQNYILHSYFYKKVSDLVSFSVGIQADKMSLNPGSLKSEKPSDVQEKQLMKESGIELAAYMNSDWKFTDAFSMSIGLRYSSFLLLGPYQKAIYSDESLRVIENIEVIEKNDIGVTYHYPEPRLGARLKLAENISIKASYALTRQYLQNIYNSTTPLPTSRWKLSDSYIKPQIGHSYSLGYYQNFFENTITLGVEGYFRDIDNVIDYKPGADFFLSEFIEKDILQGNGKNYGIEFSVEKPYGQFNGWFNYTYARSMRQFDAVLVSDRINNNQWFPSDFDRPHVFNGTMNYKANSFNTFSFNFTYQAGRPYSIPNATITTENVVVPIFLERNNSRLKPYHRLDFSWRVHNITTKKTRWKGDWIFTVYNLYARNNAFNIFYAPKTPGRLVTTKGVGPLGAYQLSIFNTALISIGYNFTFK